VSNDKRRRRRPDYRAPRVGNSSRSESQDSGGGTKSTGGFLGFLSRSDPTQSPYPSFRESFGKAMIAVCGSPVIVLTVLALVFLVRIALVWLRVPPRASGFALVLGLPPVGTLFDLQAAGTILGDTRGFLLIPVFILLRSLILAELTGMVVESLRTGRVSTAGLGRGIRAFPALLGVEIVVLGIVLVGGLILNITGLGALAAPFLFVAVLFLFGYAPAVAIEEPRGLQWTARRSIRAARIPGSQNVFLALLYVVPGLLLAPAFVPGGQAIDANPGVGTWVGVLVLNVLHVVFLAVYCHRYLVAEDEIPDPAEPQRRR